MARKKRRSLLGPRRPRKRQPELDEDTPKLPKKEELANWKKGAVVEIYTWVPFRDKKGHDYFDPNVYLARCTTGGNKPTLEVVDEETGERHDKFPRLLFPGDYSILRLVM